MLPRTVSFRGLTIIPALIILSLVGMTWSATGNYYQTRKLKSDTIPSADQKVRPDAAIRESQVELQVQLDALNKAMQHLDEQMKNKNWEQMQKNVQEAISRIDMDKINKQLDEAMKQIDLAKIKVETQAALSRIDYEKIRQQLNEALKELKNNADSIELKKEINTAIDEAKRSLHEVEKVELKEMEAELKQAKEELKLEKMKIKEEMEEVKKELREEKINIQSELASARKEIAEERALLSGYRDMITEMENDGLVKKDEDYSIEFRDNGLYVNGRKQSDKIYNRYKAKVKKEKLSVKKQNGKIFIDQ